MTRRNFLWTPALATSAASRPPLPMVVPVHRISDIRAQYPPGQHHRFWWSVWPEAARDFARGGIQLQTSDTQGEIRRSPADRPLFAGLKPGVLNLVLTDHIPMKWDQGRALAGITALDEGYSVSVIALRYAHGDRIPFVSVNTCVHELLHALLGDIFVSRPTWFQGGERESRVDWYATRLWLFHDGAAVRKSAEACLRHLRAPAAPYSPKTGAGMVSTGPIRGRNSM
jgi:hypothetical protein